MLPLSLQDPQQNDQSVERQLAIIDSLGNHLSRDAGNIAYFLVSGGPQPLMDFAPDLDRTKSSVPALNLFLIVSSREVSFLSASACAGTHAHLRVLVFVSLIFHFSLLLPLLEEFVPIHVEQVI